jgi:UDP-N-acetylmuramate dehydrogenase
MRTPVSLTSGFERIIRENEPLAPFTRLNLGGVAEYFAEPTSVEELAGLAKRFTDNGLPIRLVGAGSNLLVRSDAVAGLVIHLSAPDFCQIVVDGDTLKVGGGTRLSHFVATAVREGLSGPHHLVGFPGTVGGALHSNISVPLVEMGNWIQSVTVMKRTGEQVTHESESINLSYSHSSLSEMAILSATFKFERETSELLTKQMQKMWIVRRAAQPATDENSANIFKDIGGDTASTLIESAGLKGMKVGNVEVSDRDPNYFVAHPGATTDEVIQLIELVKTQVSEKLDLELETLIQIW